MNELIRLLERAESDLKKVDKQLQNLPEDVGPRLAKLSKAVWEKEVIILNVLMEACAGFGKKRSGSIGSKWVPVGRYDRKKVEVSLDGKSVKMDTLNTSCMPYDAAEIVRRELFPDISSLLLKKLEKILSQAHVVNEQTLCLSKLKAQIESAVAPQCK